MTNRNFDEWLSKFRPSISSYDYYIDFENECYYAFFSGTFGYRNNGTM